MCVVSCAKKKPKMRGGCLRRHFGGRCVALKSANAATSGSRKLLLFTRVLKGGNKVMCTRKRKCSQNLLPKSVAAALASEWTSCTFGCTGRQRTESPYFASAINYFTMYIVLHPHFILSVNRRQPISACFLPHVTPTYTTGPGWMACRHFFHVVVLMYIRIDDLKDEDLVNVESCGRRDAGLFW